ncbi:MAG TPA: NHL repeat-containing protein [Chitinophagaceae bacterium]|nr:NHL repeat-containing protein [Chitinophagaceae bacterium]
MQKLKASTVIEPLKELKNILKKDHRRFTSRRKYQVTTVAGDGTPGYTDGPALLAKFKSPLDIAVMPDGRIYIADGFNSSIRVMEKGQVTTFAGNGNANITDGIANAARFKIPSRLTLDEKGNLYVLDAADPRVRKIGPDAGVTTYAGTNRFGHRDGAATVAQFGQSFGIVSDLTGNIYIADSQNHRIRKISRDRFVSTIAGTGIEGVVNGKGDIAQFYLATGIVIDKLGNLFVSDINRIRKITPNGMVSTFTGGDTGYEDGEKDVAKFSRIEDVAIDDRGNIFVTDENRVRKVTPNGFVSTLAGSTAGYQDGDGTSAKFNNPQGLTLDQDGNIYVADFINIRIRKISPG